jgi:hypothetical protein
VLDGSHDPQHHLPINQARPMAVASDIFDGVMAIHLRGLPNTQPGLFEGKKRFFHIMCQVGCLQQLTESFQGWHVLAATPQCQAPAT